MLYKLFVLTAVYNRNTAWLRDTVRQTSRGKSAAAGRTAVSWPYRVTTQYSFYPVQCIVNTTKVKLWNYKSNDLPVNGLPTRMWSRQPIHQLEKVSEGRRPEHLLNILSWCWWNFLTSANQIAQIVTGQGSMSPTWEGRVSDPGKMDFIKSIKPWIILLYIWLHP